MAQGNSGSSSTMSTASTKSATVSFCGTVQRVDPHSCLLVNPSEPIGTAYDITGTRPVPKIGVMIAGHGTPKGTSTCGSATRLTKVKWAKAAACPLVK